MKLIDIMKRYNKCILKENAKLRSIYNTLIRECDGADVDNECDVSECGDKEENDCDVNETEGTKMSVAEFLGECGKENGADDSSEKEQIDEVNDGDLMTAEEFFGGGKPADDGKTKADECDACGDDSCKNGEKCGLKEDDDEEIEEEDDEEIEEEDDEKIEEDEELISKKEFYAANESDDEEIEEEDDEEIEESDDEEIEESDDEEIEEEDEDAEKDVTESKKKDKEAKLSESLEKHYRAANRKLFNF